MAAIGRGTVARFSVWLVLALCAVRSLAAEDESRLAPDSRYGFVEASGGVRTQDDDHQSRDLLLGELRYQEDLTWYLPDSELQLTADVYADGVTERVLLDLRKLSLSVYRWDVAEVKAGVQVSTWGTGDYLFINDLFPKDWQSFFIGRDDEYLKAPAPSVRVTVFPEAFDVDFVWTPFFEPDRYVTGDRLSYWSPLTQSRTGESLDADQPPNTLAKGEFALRLSKNVSGTEWAAYGYRGFWPRPEGYDLDRREAVHPHLLVGGASVRRALAGGIANAEFGYYESPDDRRGDDPLTPNSEVRALVGFKHELARELTGAVQWYVEHMLNYSEYERAVPAHDYMRDEDRHVLTLRLTKLMMSQNLMLSLFGFYSPTDGDAYVRPSLSYKWSDHLSSAVGGNWFVGEDEHTFFGQMADNSNVYARVRYSF